MPPWRGFPQTVIAQVADSCDYFNYIAKSYLRSVSMLAYKVTIEKEKRAKERNKSKGRRPYLATS